MPLSEESILAALEQVKDPDLLVNIVDLGLVYGIGVDEADGKTEVKVIMTDDYAGLPLRPGANRRGQTAVGPIGRRRHG